MLPPYLIRSAFRSDFTAIARLQADSWAASYRTVLPPHYVRERLHDDIRDEWEHRKIGKRDVVLVAEAEQNKQLLGFISVWCPPLPFIDNLHCAPAFTGHGIGARLLQEAFSTLLAQGDTTASLTVLAINEGARRFYQKHGAVVNNRQKASLSGYSVDVDIMHWSHISKF
ncbi:GNAT family N-acetyltransferase [Cohaesibacter haloalkalitolerans]|uniref:GNAT family N-acetyltransferase n=1 Tax=Cohaesibacter haloalkalitolerans TaxID=1162980 RepID=UPI000E65D951|nr:GNAT family N-acetyltransferase [Cohaesibacter haloalkalitolerans]